MLHKGFRFHLIFLNPDLLFRRIQAYKNDFGYNVSFQNSEKILWTFNRACNNHSLIES